MDQKAVKTLEQLSWCEKPIFVVLGKVLKKLESSNSLITKLQPLGFLWMLRHLIKCHLGVTEQFIWGPLKHIRMVQEKIKLIGIPQRSSGNETYLNPICENCVTKT